MSDAKTNLLVADDAAVVRMSLSHILTESGYSVRTAHDGFAALTEIRREVPDLLLSDLNMPRMSGFELLSVVRRRFSAIRVIAMSGSYLGEGVPPGVAADAFYEKGSNPSFLLRIVKAMTQSEPPTQLDRATALAPIWIPRSGQDHAGERYVMITCTECLRTFPQILGTGFDGIHEAECVYCANSIHYAIVEPDDPAQAYQRKPGAGSPTSLGVPNFGF
jgi:CheY-like chemotaxis protein